MKGISAFILLAASACAADFVTGQAARAVIGQNSFTSADPNSSNTTIGAASGIAYAADRLFVADDNRIGAAPENNRVLIFNNISATLPAPAQQLVYNTPCPICVGTAAVVLGQPDFTTNTTNFSASAGTVRQPTAVASDGVRLVVADTNHNRVMIWNHIPTANNTPADVVVGQPDFVTLNPPPGTPSATTMRGPQGVWIQNGKLYVADTQNNRIMIYNHIPTTNGVAADVVLGQPNFTTFVEIDITQQTQAAAANNMLNPVSVTSDGTRLFVTDLGFNRVLIWNSIPSSNGAAADVVVGQPDFVSAAPNNAFTTDTNGVETAVLCTVSNGVDANNNPTYPTYCNSTLNFPRFALSDGTRLFIADGGNDRVLEFVNIPTQNGASADTILGQIGGNVDQATDAADSMNTPTSLAWDGTNLYVSDPYNLRITVFSIAPNALPYQAVVNTANQNVYATGQVTIGLAAGSTITSGDIATITINGTNYSYTVTAADTVSTIIDSLVTAINAGSGDPNVIATEDQTVSEVVLQARLPGPQGDNVTYSAAASTNAVITVTAAGTNLTGGGNAAQVAPGTIVSINGTNLSSQTASADLTQPNLPTTLGGVQVYFNGIPAPLTFVSPTQINAQIPWEFTATTSINAYVRSVMADGSVMVTTPVAVTMVPANPGIFGVTGTTNPEIGIVVHGSSHATGVVSVDGTVNAGDVATITIQNRSYSYTVTSGDTLASIRDQLIGAINASEPLVTASAASQFQRIILTAKVQGPDGDTITYTGTASTGADVIITPFGNTLCCANVAGAPVTYDNPALPGETILVYATGLGLPDFSQVDQSLIVTGQQYPVGGPLTAPVEAQSVSSIAGGSTADVLDASLVPGMVGIYGVLLHLNSSLATNQYTAVTISQDVFTSNSVSFPVLSPASPGASTASVASPADRQLAKKKKR
jgi:uncharacterized protein (TIGR03437 family)